MVLVGREVITNFCSSGHGTSLLVLITVPAAFLL